MKTPLKVAVLILLLLSSYVCHATDTWATLSVQINSAMKAKDYAQAEQLAIKTLQLFESGQETNIHEQVYTLYTLGEIYRAQNKIAPAENYLKKAYEISLRSEGDKPGMSRVMMCGHIAEVLLDDSKADEAENLLRSCLPKSPPQTFDKDDYEARNRLIRALQFKKKLDDAETMSKDQLQYVQRALPPDSIEIAEGLNALSLSIQNQDLGKRLGEATGYMQQAWAMCVKAYDENNLECATFEDNLGEQLTSAKKFDEAEKHIKSVLQVRTLKLGENDPFTASTAFSLGRLYFLQERYEEAVPILKKGTRQFQSDLWYKQYLSGRCSALPGQQSAQAGQRPGSS